MGKILKLWWDTLRGRAWFREDSAKLSGNFVAWFFWKSLALALAIIAWVSTIAVTIILATITTIGVEHLKPVIEQIIGL